MGAKITLTGTRAGKIRKTAKYYTFEMELGGSKSAPKGLPLASENIQYTVFVSLKAGKKAKLDVAPKDQKWLIQGEIVLDIPVQDCPGEIGVIAFQIAELPSKAAEKPSQNKVTAEQEIKGTKAEVAATTDNQPNQDTVEPAPTTVIKLGDIQVPEPFLQTRLNPYKTDQLRDFVREHGQLDKPIHLCLVEGSYWLVDGYRRYVVAREFGIEEVSVKMEPPTRLEELIQKG